MRSSCQVSIVFDELKYQVDRKRIESETHYSSTESVEDEIFDGCKVIFQTTIEPLLEDGLMDIQHDDKFIGKFVQVVGHIQILEAGNAMFSMHIVEPAFNSLGGLDRTTYETFNSQSSNNESINP